MISVVIRNKNQSEALSFLLKNLTKRYVDDIDEIIVVDNLSVDNSKEVAEKFGAKFETISKFTYGGSANFCAEKATNDIIVIFSAHSYPVSPDFFSTIKTIFDNNKKLAGLRCLHSTNDYKNYIENISANQDPNKSGLIFSGSAFRKSVWELIKFNENVPTFEDKDWTKRVLRAGYDIDFAPVVFSYSIKRTPAQEYFRFTKDVLGNYQIWHQEHTLFSALKGFMFALIKAFKMFLIQVFYAFKRLFFMIQFKWNKPDKFEY